MSNVATPGPREVPRVAARPPALVPWWTMVAPSKSLRRGGIVRFDFGEHPLVVFRGRDDGVVRAIPAHCQHQGVDLARGSIVGDCLQCPLHHWQYDDRCVHVPGIGETLSRQRFVARERHGMIFIHPGDDAPPLPAFISVDESMLHFHSGAPLELDCPWYVPVANAFDMTHLRTVHRRELIREPEISYPDAMTFVVRYSTSVTGASWSDRAMRFLSRNQIDVIVTNAGGTMVIIEATAGPMRSFMMISLRPRSDGGVSILPLYAVPRSRVHLVHAPIARMLFSAFLHRDFSALRGIRFPDRYVDQQDPTINACYRHLCELPAYEERR